MVVEVSTPTTTQCVRVTWNCLGLFDRVDTPTEQRVKQWAFGFEDLLKDATGQGEFEQFLQTEFSSENIHFWQACEELKCLPVSKVPDKVNDVYKEFLASGAPCEINIDSKTMEATMNSMKNPNRYTFDAAQNHIFLLMKKDSYPRFLRSEHYKSLLATAINPHPKKKFLFPFGTKKKSPNPSPKPKRRGSMSSEASDRLGHSGTLSQHSYSTGNLKELAGDKSNKSSPFGSNTDIKNAETSSTKSFSPKSLRKKLDDIIKGSPSRSNSNLQVPNQYSQVDSPNGTPQDGDVNIQVPNAASNTNDSNFNVVAPWESA